MIAQRLFALADTVGKTIAATRETTVDSSYTGLAIEFTDASYILLIGGGYENYGDYLRVAGPTEDETP